LLEFGLREQTFPLICFILEPLSNVREQSIHALTRGTQPSVQICDQARQSAASSPILNHRTDQFLCLRMVKEAGKRFELTADCLDLAGLKVKQRLRVSDQTVRNSELGTEWELPA
jgi:hypothetical protein